MIEEDSSWLDNAADDEESWLDGVYDPKEPIYLPVPRGVSALPIPKDEAESNTLLHTCWNALTRKQQIFLDSLQKHSFNIRATCRVLERTNDKVARTSIANWSRNNEDFKFCLKMLKAIKRKEVVDEETLLLRANDIAEQALTPKPILYQGKPTGFYENNLGHALSANEQLMKATGMLKGDKNDTRVMVRVVNLAGAEEAVDEKSVLEAEVADA